MKDDLAHLAALERELKLVAKRHFIDYFASPEYQNGVRTNGTYAIGSLDDVEKTYFGTGIYIDMSDYRLEENQCSLQVNGLKAIYRGHCYRVKTRLKSHLFNDHYRRSLSDRGVRYDVCMKLDGNNGINVIDPPYRDYKWGVVIHKMPKSSKLIREQAERAFDEVFGRPLASREIG